MPSCEPVGNPKVILSWGNHTEIHPATGKSSKTVLASNTEVNTGDNSSVATIEDVKEVNLTCEADGLPNPMYIWYDSCVQKYIYAQRITILMTGSYTCIANNSISGRDFSERITIQVNLPASQSQSACTTVDPEGNNANNCVLGISKGLCILVLVIVIVFGLNILLTFAFLIYYGCSKTGREKINNKFRWIEKALPCLNGNDCQCSWEMFFFIFCSVIGGIIFIPYVLIASHCCQNNTKKSQDTYSLDESQSTNENSHENGGQHHKTLNSAVGQNPAHSPPPAPYRSPSQGARYPPAQQNFHHSTSNNRRQGPPYPPNPEGVVYQDLRIDFSPGSRRPVELMDATNCGGEYADLHST